MLAMPRSLVRCAVPNESSQRPGVSGEVNPPAIRAREIDSQELMQGEREIVIRHGTVVYRLSVTRSGKLILRK